MSSVIYLQEKTSRRCVLYVVFIRDFEKQKIRYQKSRSGYWIYGGYGTVYDLYLDSRKVQDVLIGTYKEVSPMEIDLLSQTVRETEEKESLTVTVGK